MSEVQHAIETRTQRSDRVVEGASRLGCRSVGWAWVLVPALAPLIVFWEALAGRRIIAPGDGLSYYLPLQVSVADAWRAGSFPGWDRGTFAGSPLFAIHQSAALAPTTLLGLVLPPVFAHNLTIISALVIAGVGAHLFAHRLTGDHAAAAVAGSALAFCGFQFAHLAHVSIIATSAWLPWSLWAIDRVVERATPRRVAAGAVVVALASLSGHGQMLAYLLVATGTYAVIVAGRARLRGLGAAAVTLVAGLALAAVQLVPVVAAIGGSDRSSLSLEEATAYSQDPKGLLVSVAPFLYGHAGRSGPVTTPYAGHWTLTELGGYVGAAALVLAAVGVPVWRRNRRVGALLVLALLSTLVALGDATPIGSVVHALPLFGQMRSWARYTLGLQLAVAVLAAVGVAEVRAGRRTWRVRWPALAAVAVAVALAVAPGLAPARVAGGELAWAVGAPLAAALVAGAVVCGVRRWPAAVLALLLLVIVDPVTNFGWWFRWRDASPTPAQAMDLVDGRTPPPWGRVPDAAGGVDRYLWAGDYLASLPHGPRVAAAAGQFSATGMDPLAPADHLDATGTDYLGNLREPSKLLGRRSHLLDLLRVTVVARPTDGGVKRTERRPALPEAFLVGATRRADRREAVAAATGQTVLRPGSEALIEHGCAQCPGPSRPGRAGEAGPVRWGRNSATVDVAASRPAVLVVSQSWSPGWTASVDGRSVPVVRVDGVVQGVAVPAGRSHVVLWYRAPGLVTGAAVSATTALALAVAMFVGRRHGQGCQNENHSRRSMLEGGSGHPVHTG